MTAADALLTIAEMAVGFAGFSAVVGVFTTRGELSRLDRSRFVYLFTSAFAAAVLAFVPILLSESGFEGPELWVASSGTMVVVWLLGAALGLRNRDPSVTSIVEGPLMFIPGVGNLLIQIGNVWGAFWHPSPAIYIAGNLIWLYATGLIFVSIVLERPAARPATDADVE